MPGRVTITTAPAATSLTTLATAKARLGIADSSQDVAVTALIGRATAAIGAYCGRPLGFGRAQIAESFAVMPPRNTHDPAPLVLTYPPADVAAVAVNGVTLADGLTAGVPAEWESDGNPGLVYRLSGGYRIPWGAVRPVVVTYATGYALPGDASPDLPAEIESACLDLIESGHANASRDLAVSSERVEGVGETRYFDRGATGMHLDDAARATLAAHIVRGF